jgi:hypothetical protein
MGSQSYGGKCARERGHLSAAKLKINTEPKRCIAPTRQPSARRFAQRLGSTKHRNQPPLARSVLLSRFTPRVGGGSAVFVRRQRITYKKTQPYENR